MAYRLALVTAGATLLLILFGGLVTNSGAALAVPDWPTTFGRNMFLFPVSGMVGGVFYEHGHRLIGAAVGLLTLGLAAALWPRGGRLRWLGVAAVVAVCVQGVIGGLRVVLLRETLAMIHGPLAQAFFALVVTLALLTSPRMARPAAPVEPALRALAVAAAGLTYLQIVLGALLTHGARLDLHLAGAVGVFAVLPLVTARARRTGDAVAAPVARLLLLALAAQLVLGAGAYVARFTPLWIPGGQTSVLLLPVLHRLTGAVILGAVVAIAVRVLASPIARRPAVEARRPQPAVS